jgi:hypothetical protein
MQMNTKSFFLLLSFTGILFSCSNSKYQENRMVFSESKKLYAEKIPVNEIFSPDFITKSGNYLVISSHKTDTTLFLYNTPSLTFSNSTGRKGSGPDDIGTFPMFCHTTDNKYLYIRGYSPLSVRKISIQPQGSFSFIDEYKLGYDEYNCMNLIKDSLFIYYTIDELAIKKYDLKNNALLKEIKLKKDDHKESYYYSNRGLVAANDSFVIYPYMYKKQIDIYDVDNLKLMKRMNDGKEYPDVVVYDDKNIIYRYLNVYAGKKYFYVIYDGHKMDGNYSGRTLEVYDYAGNSIIKYTFDIVPFLFVVDEENGYIYGYNSYYEDFLLKYKL